MRRISAGIVAAIVVGVLVAGSPLSAQGRKMLKSVAPPTGITFQASGTDVTVAWTAPPGAASYRILRSSSPMTPGTDITAPVATTSVADRSLTPGATYYYQVVAVYPGGEQATSSPVAYTAPPVTLVARTPQPKPLGHAIPPTVAPMQPSAGTAPGGASALNTGTVSPRTITLAGFTASGIFSTVAPRTITLGGFTASGVFSLVAPRTITLAGFIASGVFSNVAPRTITLPGWTGVGN